MNTQTPAVNKSADANQIRPVMPKKPVFDIKRYFVLAGTSLLRDIAVPGMEWLEIYCMATAPGTLDIGVYSPLITIPIDLTGVYAQASIRMPIIHSSFYASPSVDATITVIIAGGFPAENLVIGPT